MPTRARRSQQLIRRVRDRGPAASRLAPPPPDAPVPARDEGAPGLEERRDLDPSLDLAVYNCDCGLVFEAPVCTSVDCPHCGNAQAW